MIILQKGELKKSSTFETTNFLAAHHDNGKSTPNAGRK